MLKIFKNIKKKTERKIYQYAQENIDELSKILNRPKEGEIVKISNIKIQEQFTNPKTKKMKKRLQYFEKYGYFRSVIILNNKNYLVDGYTTYLLAIEKGFNYITILRED